MITDGWSDGTDDADADDADAEVAAALAAERETLSLECRADPVRLGRFLAPDFHEFGSSGSEIGVEGTADRVAAYTDPAGEPIRIERLRGRRIADGIVLVKYTSENLGARSNRTSLWRRTADGWRIFHHQGTPTRD